MIIRWQFRVTTRLALCDSVVICVPVGGNGKVTLRTRCLTVLPMAVIGMCSRLSVVRCILGLTCTDIRLLSSPRSSCREDLVPVSGNRVTYLVSRSVPLSIELLTVLAGLG